MDRAQKIDTNLQLEQPDDLRHLFRGTVPIKVDVEAILLKYAREIYSLPYINYLPIRPSDTNYNRTYLNDHEESYSMQTCSIDYPG